MQENRPLIRQAGDPYLKGSLGVEQPIPGIGVRLAPLSPVFRHPGIYARRDSLPSIAYSEELISATISATLQSTDRHHGIVVQKRSHFQLDS
jgi:hypothetical protein